MTIQKQAKTDAEKQLEQAKAQQDKKDNLKRIQVAHGQTMRKVAMMYGSDTKPIFVDRG